ncbi:hypothetical protein IFM89_034481 [Coptis chinensis]|uniref:protein-serine/threonine phosphatase n=1 Tax=Coptis chinensis TaxID=261450 RepID=A0A835H8M8_9MAGN|nr:hypothetical protein IFM89_034481 [Coptis chinensis]
MYGSMSFVSPRNLDSINNIIRRLLEESSPELCCVSPEEIISVCHHCSEVLLSEGTLLQVKTPVHVLGDLHGQFPDLLHFFEKIGYPPHCRCLFLGDYVDRGKQSIEVAVLLFCYKIKFPGSVY